MLQTLHPYTPTAKTAEIMARYRPIAPKPQPAAASSNTGVGGLGDEGSGSGSRSGSSPPTMSRTIRQSPYLRNVWPHLQSRPTRTRKRGRTSLGPPPLAAFKRPRTLLQGLSPPFHITTSPAKTLSLQGFAPTTLVTLPLLQPHHMQMQMQSDIIDLNKTAEIPEEQDLLAQLQKPPTATVISPTPIRLIRSTVTIRDIKPDQPSHKIVLKPSEHIEQELESQTMPAFVTDSNHQVRLVNSSYQEMVGQPECEWVQSMVATCNSICGNVVLKFTDLENDNDNDNDNEDVIGSGFSCWAQIEWGANGERNMVNAFGEVKRLACESKDYKFAWRFHTRQAAAAFAVVENVQDQDQDMESVNLKRNS